METIEDFVVSVLLPLIETGHLGSIEVPRGSLQKQNLPEIDIDEDISEEAAVKMTDGSSNKTISTISTSRELMSVSKPEACATFTQMLSVAASVTELISTEKTMSLRDVYYSNKHLFQSQQQSDTIVLDLGRTLGMRRHEMGIVPASKGLVAGHLKFAFKIKQSNIPNQTRSSKLNSNDSQNSWGSMKCCLEAAEDGGLLISPKWTSHDITDITIHVPTCVKYILVVEKEGIFKRLVEDGFYNAIPCIIVTGCGFPDVATRSLVSKIANHMTLSGVQVVGICDYNPYGAALIMSYMISSIRSKTILETSENGLCPQLRWLGFRYKHIEELLNHPNIDRSAFQSYSIHDTKKINGLLQNKDVFKQLNNMEMIDTTTTRSMQQQHFEERSHAWINELTLMKDKKIKCELEAIYALGIEAVAEWIQTCLENNDYI